MSEKAKQIVVLFIGAVVITGIIVVQARRSRPVAPVDSIPETAAVAGEAETTPPDADLPAGFGPRTTEPVPLAATGEDAGRISGTAFPAGQWGRNPFLTPDEIAAMERQTPPVRIAEEPEPAPPPPGPGQPLPEYTVTAILSNENGSSAVVNSRVVRPGDRLGSETVVEITGRGIVLESNGERRQILMNGSGSRAVEPRR